MHDLVIHRGAKHAGIVVIALKRRLGSKLLNLRRCNRLEIHGSDAWLYCCHSGVQHMADNSSAASLLLDPPRRFTHDGHQATLSHKTEFRAGSFPPRITASEPLGVR